jgi:DNA-binding IclR family transcriptional regulator
LESRSLFENGAALLAGADAAAAASVPSVERALDILEYLETCEGRPTLTEIAARLDLPRASAHRLLATLRARGYVEQDATSRGSGYALGTRTLGIAARAQAGLDVARIAQVPMQHLAEATGEGCQLSIRSGDQALCVARVPSPQHPEVALMGRVGSAFPLHAVAVGKVLLAYAPEADRAAYLSGQLKSFTLHTQVSPDALVREFDAIRRSGIARDEQEYKLGLRALAAPVFEHDGATIHAALGLPLLVGAVAGASEDLWEITEALRATANAISRALGFHAAGGSAAAATSAAPSGGLLPG